MKKIGTFWIFTLPNHSAISSRVLFTPKVKSLHSAMPHHLAIVDDVAERSASRVVCQIDANPGLPEKHIIRNLYWSCLVQLLAVRPADQKEEILAQRVST